MLECLHDIASSTWRRRLYIKLEIWWSLNTLESYSICWLYIFCVIWCMYLTYFMLEIQGSSQTSSSFILAAASHNLGELGGLEYTDLRFGTGTDSCPWPRIRVYTTETFVPPFITQVCNVPTGRPNINIGTYHQDMYLLLTWTVACHPHSEFSYSKHLNFLSGTVVPLVFLGTGLGGNECRYGCTCGWMKHQF